MKLKSTVVVFTFLLSMILSGICTAASEETIPNEGATKLEHTLWSKALGAYPLRPPIIYDDKTLIITSSRLLAIETLTGNLLKVAVMDEKRKRVEQK